jgi:hypothetical protein
VQFTSSSFTSPEIQFPEIPASDYDDLEPHHSLFWGTNLCAWNLLLLFARTVAVIWPTPCSYLASFPLSSCPFLRGSTALSAMYVVAALFRLLSFPSYCLRLVVSFERVDVFVSFDSLFPCFVSVLDINFVFLICCFLCFVAVLFASILCFCSSAPTPLPLSAPSSPLSLPLSGICVPSRAFQTSVVRPFRQIEVQRLHLVAPHLRLRNVRRLLPAHTHCQYVVV